MGQQQEIIGRPPGIHGAPSERIGDALEIVGNPQEAIGNHRTPIANDSTPHEIHENSIQSQQEAIRDQQEFNGELIHIERRPNRNPWETKEAHETIIGNHRKSLDNNRNPIEAHRFKNWAQHLWELQAAQGSARDGAPATFQNEFQWVSEGTLFFS